MELVDEYLQSVRNLLPKGERDDIVAELSANVAAQMDEKRGELGRPLTEAEQRVILQRLGSPLVVAGRYTDERRSLTFGHEVIGPVLFPLYARVLALNLVLAGVICVAVVLALRGPAGLFSAIPAILLQLLIQFAILTAIFALAQRHLARLPGSDRVVGVDGTPRPDAEAVSRLESFAQLVALAGLFAGFYTVRRFGNVLFTPAGNGLYFAPVWRPAIGVLLVLAAAWTVQALVNLVQPQWTRFKSVVGITTGVAWLGLLAWLLARGPWVLVSTAAAAPHAARAADAANTSVFYTLVATILLSAFLFLQQIIAAARRRPGHREP